MKDKDKNARKIDREKGWSGERKIKRGIGRDTKIERGNMNLALFAFDYVYIQYLGLCNDHRPGDTHT